jgi:hypothetical protein
MGSEANKKMQDFRDNFAKLKSAFQDQTAVETQITVIWFRLSMEKELKNLGE